MSGDTSKTLSFSFPKSRRLLDQTSYSRVFDQADIKVSRPQLLVLAKHNTLGHPRLGLIVAKKNVRLANQRNHFKRHAREQFRLLQHTLPAIDAIVLARRGVNALSDNELSQLMSTVWRAVAQKARNKAL